MKKRVYWTLCLTSLAAVLVTALLSLWVFYGFYTRQTRDDLRSQSQVISRALALYEDPAPAVAALSSRYDALRVTLIDPEGVVLADSVADVRTMENHNGREEVVEARAGGQGEAMRRSDTLGVNTYYYAQRLEGGLVLRVARQTDSILGVFMGLLPNVVAITVLLMMVCVTLSARITRGIVAPLERMARDMDEGLSGDYDEELDPFLTRIRSQNELIQGQVERLRQERDTVRLITENMREGMILVSGERNVLSINPSARAMLQAPDVELEGKSLWNVTRSRDFSRLVDAALSGRSADMILRTGDRYEQLYASPVYNADAVCGAIVLIHDVTERQQSDQIRRDFSANVSHELKTPLTSITGFAEMLSQDMITDPEDVRRFAGLIHQQAQRLITLIDDIMRLSRIEEGRDSAVEPVDLYAAADNVVQALTLIAGQRDVTLRLTGASAVVEASPRMMEELLFNLCDNAIKYNKPRGRVDIHISLEGREGVLTVGDTGIGIPPEHQGRVFERFYRVDKSRSKQTGGTGLGLSIVKHIVEYHHGTLELTSQAGEGTRITVRLPVQGPPRQA